MKKHFVQKTEFRDRKTPYSQGQRRAFAPQSAPSNRDHTPIIRTSADLTVQGLFNAGTVQAKLDVSRPDDICEKEADRIADQVVGHLGRAVEDKQTRLRCNAPQIPGHETFKEALTDSLRNSGQPLERSVRSAFESRFGWDFSGVRVHSDSTAGQAARSIHAKAFTTGSHIFFASGQYRPTAFEGQKLIAHELTHVLQQQPGIVHRKSSEAQEDTAWAGLAKKAKTALASGDNVEAKMIYREAILHAAGTAIIPEGLPALKPISDDIQLDLSMADSAETRCGAVAGNERNYWRWIYFGKGSIEETRAFTEMVVSHELVHVRQFKNLLAQYQKQSSSSQSKWEDYCKVHSPEARVLGPEEMEAEITSLGFMKKLKPAEQRLSLRGIFVAYARSTAYVPPVGEKIGLTAEGAKPRILEFFKNAETDLKQEMGNALWWGLIKAEPAKDVWKKVIQDLKPIAVQGYSDKDFRPHYDSFLKDKGLSFAEVTSASGEKAPPAK